MERVRNAPSGLASRISYELARISIFISPKFLCGCSSKSLGYCFMLDIPGEVSTCMALQLIQQP